MKKWLALLLGLVLALSLAACGSSSTTTDEPATDAAAEPADDGGDDGGATEVTSGGYTFEIIVKSYQSSYWQAAVQGIDSEAAALGVTANSNGPNAESDIADQVQMLNDAINKNPDGIGLAACDQEAVLDSLQAAMDAGIPVVCFDSGVPDAPAGSVYSTVATDNYGAGEIAAEHLYEALADRIAASETQVRIGEVNQESTSESITSRGLGFIDKFIELAKADGYSVAVTGNDYYVDGCVDKGDSSTANIIIDVGVPAQTTVELCATEASNILNKTDTIGIFGSNQVAAEGILTANDNLGVLGSDPELNILAAGFDAGATIKDAVRSGVMFGAVTQSPLAMGITTIDVLTAIANGEEVSDVPTDGYWYNSENMDSDDIAPNLYD